MQHLDDGILQAWLDGPRSGLSVSERDEIQRHLATCDACARRLEELEELSGRVEALLSGPEVETEPVPAFEAVVARARGSAPSGRQRSRWTSAAWAASVAAAVGLGWLGSELYRGGGTVPTHPTPPRAAEAAQADSSSPAPVMAAARPATDTPVASPPAAGAPAPLKPPAAPVVASGRASQDTASHASPTPARPRPAMPVVVNAKSPTAVKAQEATPSPTPLEPNVGAQGEVARPNVALPADSAPALIRGRVTDDSGKPLSAVQVMVDGTNVGALTQPDGTFQLSLGKVPVDSAARPVTVSAQLIGYGMQSRRLAARAGSVDSADFRLTPQAVSLNAIVVTGTAGKAAPKRPDTAGIVIPLGDPAWGAWKASTRDEAERHVGFPLLEVPELLVKEVDVASTAGVSLARVVQILPDGGSLELVQARVPVRFSVPGAPDNRGRATARRGDVYVTASALLPLDALKALLDRLK